MGFNIQSVSTTNTLNDFNSTINSAIFNVVNNASVSCSAGTFLDLKVGSFLVSDINGNKTFAICPTTAQGIDVSQFSNQTCSLTQQATNNLQQDATNSVNSAIKSWINNNLSNNQGWLAIATSVATTNNQNVDDIVNKLTNTLTADITNKCSSFLQGSESGIISICGDFGNKGITVNQSVIQTNLTSCITKNTISAIQSNTVVNNIAQQVDNKLANTQEGLSTIAKYIIIAVVAVVVLIIIGVILYFVFGGSKAAAPNNEMNAKEREKRMLEREVIEKREKMEGKPTNAVASFTTRGNADESAKELFERHDKLTSPTYLDRFKSLASKYGGMAASTEA
jgi:hypothetical protein